MPTNIEQLIEIVAREVKSYQTPVVDLIAVQTKDPFKVLVATILSARTKDEVTAKASERLFTVAPDRQSLGLLSEDAISKLIYPVGFYKAKAGYLNRLPEALTAFGGEVPDAIDDLVTLPGVGRKTANLVRSVAFAKPAICVDTHVHRIMNIWGYVETKTPLETEMTLREQLPDRYWLTINSILVAFGQGTCKPVSPHCDICPVEHLCPKLGVKPRKIAPKKRTSGRTLISWNVNGIRAMEKKGFVDLVRDLSPDIFAIQETKAHPEQLSNELLNIPGYNSFWAAAMRKGYSGVAVYSKEKPRQVISGIGLPAFDQEGRVLTLEYEDFFLINAYFPNAQHGLLRIDFKLEFNHALHRFANTLAQQKSVVLCGDFNVAHKAIDLKNPKENEENPGYSLPERQWMDEFTSAGYIDTFREFNQEPEQYTWWSYRVNARQRNIGWRIDYFCVDPSSRKRVKDARILAEVMGSDHCPVTLLFA
ncbi:MAG: exodeoxyribonuclease III [Desulfobulbaceae bacterium]|nr:exodeoxyribonuclease III [Desulfobulbaceae bacterium]